MQTISKITRQLIIENPFYGLYLIGLNKKFTKEVDYAAVSLNGINLELLINPDQWKQVNDNFKYFLLLHELGHLLFFHIQDILVWRAKHPNHELLNIAMDCEVNSYIDDKYNKEDLTGTANILFRTLPSLKKRQGTTWYYNELSKLNNHIKNSKNSNGGKTGNSTSKQDSSDVITDYEQANDLTKSLIQQCLESSDLHTEWKELSDKLSKGNLSDLVRSQSEYLTKQAAEQVFKSRGSIPGQFKELIDKLFAPKPPVFNWKQFFRQKLGIAFDIFQKKSKRKESKRFEDFYGLKRKKKHKILVGIDTSGSIRNKEFIDFFSEIHHIYLAGADIHILECDTQIANEYEYKGKTPEQVHGRGGTSFIPVIDYYNKHAEYNSLVYFTDGYGDQESCIPNKQVLWIITSDGDQQSDYPGIKICIPKNNE